MGDAACCPTCRLVQPYARGLCTDCESTVIVRFDSQWGRLLAQRVVGLVHTSKRPSTGLIDRLKLLGVGVATAAAAAAGVLITRDASGLLLGPAVAGLGYTKQFWEIVARRKHYLAAVVPPHEPIAPALTGTAQPWDKTAIRKRAGDPAVLVATTTLWAAGGILFRAVNAVPFWLIDDAGARTLVAGSCWIAQPPARPRPATRRALLDATRDWMGIPPELELPRAVLVHRSIRAGDAVRVVGEASTEHIPELASYRDAHVRVVRGAPGAVAWIHPLASQSSQ